MPNLAQTNPRGARYEVTQIDDRVPEHLRHWLVGVQLRREDNQKQARFLFAISQFPGITRACKAAGIAPIRFYKSWKQDPVFMQAYNVALEMGKEKFEELQRERAESGWMEPKFGSKVVDFKQMGSRTIPIVETAIVGEVWKFSEKLAERFLEADNPDKFARRTKAELEVSVELLNERLLAGRKRVAEMHRQVSDGA